MSGLQSLMDEIDKDLRRDINDCSGDERSHSSDSNNIRRRSSSASMSGICARYVVTKHLCKCKESLMLVNDSNLYNGVSATCGLCKMDIAKDAQFFHCRFGHDLCTQCVFKKNQSTNKASDDDDGCLLFAYDASKPTKERAKRTKKRRKTKNDQSARELRREKKKNQKLGIRIQYLENQLQLITKDKLENEVTLKLVKKKVSNLIMQQQNVELKLRESQEQNAKLKPQSQYQIICRLDENFKASKKSQSKKNKKIRENMDKIAKIEEIMGNLYSVFQSKFEKQKVEMNKLHKKVADFKRLSSSPSVIEPNAKEHDEKPGMNIFSGLVKSIESELNQLEKKPLDKDSVKKAIDDLEDIQFSD